MPTYMDVHDGFVGVSRDQLQEAHQRDLDVQDSEGVSFDQVWADPTSGKVFCLATGPDRAAVMRVHEKAGHPTDQVYEVPIEL
jgi:hypothetical protein